MTREQTIKSALKFLVHKQQEQGSWGYADNDNINKVPWNEALEWIDQQPCGDLISRQAVIDTIETDCSWDIFNDWGSRTPTGENIINAIKSVPSVETERKPGKWIKVVNPDTNEWVGGFKCSECDRCCAQMSMNYCANCGAPMEVSNDT